MRKQLDGWRRWWISLAPKHSFTSVYCTARGRFCGGEGWFTRLGVLAYHASTGVFVNADQQTGAGSFDNPQISRTTGL